MTGLLQLVKPPVVGGGSSECRAPQFSFTQFLLGPEPHGIFFRLKGSIVSLLGCWGRPFPAQKLSRMAAPFFLFFSTVQLFKFSQGSRLTLLYADDIKGGPYRML